MLPKLLVRVDCINNTMLGSTVLATWSKYEERIV
jgi:hypothetical protein